jgi:hypothetical protein
VVKKDEKDENEMRMRGLKSKGLQVGAVWCVRVGRNREGVIARDLTTA